MIAGAEVRGVRQNAGLGAPAEPVGGWTANKNKSSESR